MRIRGLQQRNTETETLHTSHDNERDLNRHCTRHSFSFFSLRFDGCKAFFRSFIAGSMALVAKKTSSSARSFGSGNVPLRSSLHTNDVSGRALGLGAGGVGRRGVRKARAGRGGDGGGKQNQQQKKQGIGFFPSQEKSISSLLFLCSPMMTVSSSPPTAGASPSTTAAATSTVSSTVAMLSCFVFFSASGAQNTRRARGERAGCFLIQTHTKKLNRNSKRVERV